MGRLESDPSDRAQEMYSSARAKILAHFDHDVNGAYVVLEETIQRFSGVTYPILTLADLAIQFKSLDKLARAITLLDEQESKNSQTYRSYIRYKAIYIALSGDLNNAIQLAKSELRGVRQEALDEFLNRLSSLRKEH